MTNEPTPRPSPAAGFLRLAAGCLAAALAAAGGAAVAGAPDPARPAPLAADVALSLPPAAAPAGADGIGLPYGTSSIDTFESPIWPDPTRWVYVADLAGPASGTRWAPSTCRARGGTRSLRANGAAPSGPPACGAPYAGAFTSSAVLALDLTNLGGAASAVLSFDLWMDAEPNEGLLVAYLTPAGTEGGYDRHILYSATGRVRNWVDGGVRLNLAEARDVYDAAWRGDLRGKQALLEFVFVSVDGSGDALGAMVDNVAFTAQPSAAPTPPPGTIERTTACTGTRDCGSVGVFAYVDVGCDRRFRRGIDAPLTMQPRIDVLAGPDALGADLGRGGRQTFNYPLGRSATFTLALPDGYAMCPDSPNPATLGADAFNRYRRASLEFRVRRP